MKLLHTICSINPEHGGPIEGIKQQASVLIQQGHEIDVLCLDAQDSSWIDNFPLKVHAMGPSVLSFGFNSRFVPWLRRHRDDYDAVIVNGIWQYHSIATRDALVGAKTPYFVFTHGMLDPWFKHTYPQKHLKKWLYWPWGDYRVLRDAKKVFFTCEEEKLLARESFWLYKANEAVTAFGVSNPPANSDELSSIFLKQYPHLQGKRLVLYLSRIHVKKGCDLLIEAFANVALRDERLHLVIAGPDQTGWTVELKIQAAKLGISHRITWPGMLLDDMKWGAFYASEVFCLPSHQENFGIVVAEALACSKPVLISNKVNIWREIEIDGAGFVANDTLEGAVLNFERWLSLGEDKFIAMKAKAALCFANRFHVERAANQLINLIKECVI